MRRVVITGASGGIGRHLAVRAMENGYSVVGIARRLPETDPGFPFIQADVGDADAVAAAFRQLRGESLWALVNAAGIASMNLLLTTPPTSMARIVGTNLLGTMYCCAEAARLLIRKTGGKGPGGRIINFSSIASPLALMGESVYAASKAGVETFGRTLARELAQFGITVNTVAPGPIDTAIVRGIPPETIDALVRRQIVRRMASPEDVWNVAEFLLGDSSAMISGDVLHVGGV